MKLLADEIGKSLQSAKHCFIRPAELERVWPQLPADERERIVREFARQHGWHVFTYSRALGAMFVPAKEPHSLS